MLTITPGVFPRLLTVAFALLVLLPSRAHAQQPTPTPDVLQSITLSPTTKSISVGAFVNYVATGHYQNGTTKNLTPKLTYISSDPAIAVATNSTQAGQSKSRVEAVAIGTVTISATDPVTGIISATSGPDAAVLTVVGRLQSITLKPAQKTVAVGGSVTYTATGNLEGGGTKNMTQKVVYASSDTSVATAPNTTGNKSLVQAVGVGTATITATDPQTNISSSASGGDGALTVVETLATATPGGATPAPSPGEATPVPTPQPTPLCGDADGDGSITVNDGIEALSFTAGLASDCTVAVCDVDGNGAVTVTDGVRVLGMAAGMPVTGQCNF